MYLSLNWVKDWLKLPKDIDSKQIATDLTMSTVEVEEVLKQAEYLDKIVVGKIKEIVKHPQADLLQVCQVDIGDSVEKIVCGGTNLQKGMLVAVALVGAKVKWHGQGDLVTLSRAKIRGVESNGMIAAAEEIGLGDLFPSKSDKEILDLSAFKLKPGQSLSQALELDDTIIDIDNKSINHRPDLWGQYGLARELAAIYRVKLKEYTVGEFKAKNQVKLRVTVEDKENCFRYLGLAIKNIKVEESPWWLKIRLQSVGIRPINNVVDVTNYVMYELGQPLHVFDAQQIAGHHIQVKQAKKGENFVTLDGKKRKLPENALMIADGQKYVAIAGIMGGQNSETTVDTTDIILESANFKAASVRRTSTALNLRSESSARFEKSLDPLLAETAIRKAAELILQFCPEAYVASKLVDVNNNPFKEISLQVEEDLINKRFGSVIPTADIKDILTRLQFGVEYKAKIFSIKVPSFRATKDISIPEDIVEEVARIYGYENISYQLPSIVLGEPSLDIMQRSSRDIKRWLSLAQDYDEVYTYAFTNIFWAEKLNLDLKKHIKVKNAVSPEQAYLNLSLLPNLFSKAEENLRWFDEFRIFELQQTFDKNSRGAYYTDNSKKKSLPKQEKYLAGIEVNIQNPEKVFLTVKGLMESMMNHWNIKWQYVPVKLPYAVYAYNIKYQDIILGTFGLLKDDLIDHAKAQFGFWQLNFTLLTKYISQVKQYQALPKFPEVMRDMAVIVDSSVTWQALKSEISKVSSLIKNLEPFDVFMGKEIGEGKKSLAFHLEFRSEEKTLMAEDVDEIMDEILEILQKKFQAILR